MARMDLCLDARLDEIDRLMGAVSSFAAAERIPAIALQRLDLVIDEILTNAINYGGMTGMRQVIKVAVEKMDGRLTLEVYDPGRAFDPLSLAEPDWDIPLEKRSIGGLGVHLVRSLTDEVAYERRGEHNRFVAVIDLVKIRE